RVAADEIRPRPDKQHTWPAMSMHGGGLARGNASLKHPHAFVFKDKRVMAGRCYQRVQSFWPGFLCLWDVRYRRGHTVSVNILCCPDYSPFYRLAHCRLS